MRLLAVFAVLLLSVEISVGASPDVGAGSNTVATARYAHEAMSAGRFFDNADVARRFDVAPRVSARLPFTREQVDECAAVEHCYLFPVAKSIGRDRKHATLVSMRKIIGRRHFSTAVVAQIPGIENSPLQRGWRMLYLAKAMEGERGELLPPPLYNNEQRATATLVAYLSVLAGGLIEYREVIQTGDRHRGRVVIATNPGDGMLFTAPRLPAGAGDWYAVEVVRDSSRHSSR